MAVEMKSQEAITRSKDVYYRGKNVEELKKLDVREVAKYLDSRCRRSVLRHFDIIEKFVKRCETSQATKKKIRTHLRDIIVVPEMVGMSIQVYNGKTFNQIDIIGEMLGHKLGEFSLSRAKISHGKAGVGATKGSKNKAKK